MTKGEAKEKIALYNGFLYWNPLKIIKKAGIIKYIEMVKESKKLFKIAKYL